MQALRSLYDELVDLYGYQLQMGASISAWRERLDSLAQRGTTGNTWVSFVESNPNDPNATYDFSARYGSLLEANSPDGHNAQLMRCGVIVVAYSLWEDQYRAKIAAECGFGSKNDVKSEVFRDLNIYRRAAVHAGRIVRDQPKLLPFLSKGAALRFTSTDMQRLFELLIGELNRLSRDYYRKDARFSLSHKLNI